MFKMLRVSVYTYQSTRKDAHVCPVVFHRRRLASAAANAMTARMREMRVHFATRREIRGLERTVSFESFDSFVSCVHSFATDRIRARIHHEGGAHQGAVETPQDEAEKGQGEATTSSSARKRDGWGDVDARGRGGGEGGDGRDGGGDERGVGVGTAATPTPTRGRARQSDRARRKRELRDRISELKSKRAKIGKKNFGKSEERKRLTMMIKELERERAAVGADEERGGGGGEDEDDAMMDAE